MYKITKTYTDFNGTERTEDFYFHFKESELAEMQLIHEQGLEQKLTEIVNAMDRKKLVATFKDLILNSYGVKSEDGRQFIKNDKVRQEFEQSEAYSDIFMELITDDEAAAKFVNGIMPFKPQDHKVAENVK